ncbi:MAG: roadblock/LC7 domain-containing protein [Candidatus Lokiarchaeota archaeon]
MNKEIIESKLAQLMDSIPEIEGLIAADADGNVLIGQTLTEMDHEKIAKACAQIIKDSNDLGKNVLGKGSLKNTTIALDEGFAVLVGSESLILIAIAATDAKASLALIKRNLISISKL